MTQMMENFWSRVDGWRDELDSLYDSYNETATNIQENITKQNEISQDHLICVSNNGPTIIENLCSAHKVCNNRRGNMTLQQWFDKQRE